jgi:voltage-gated potassium channel Kch
MRRLIIEYQWAIVGVLLVASLGLGYAGFTRYGAAVGRELSPLDTLYLTLQLAVFESGAVSGPVSWELEVARWLVPVIAAYTAVLAAASLFRRQLQMVRLRFLSGHIVVCGLGSKGFSLVEGLSELGYRVVAIEQNERNPHVAASWECGAIVVVGDATDPAQLRKAAAGRARHLIAVCGDDGFNAEVAAAARLVTVGRKRDPLTCIVHVVDPHLWELLREWELDGAWTPGVRLELFNIFDRGARALLNLPVFEGSGGGGTSAPRSTRWLVVGLGRLGQSLVVQAARDWHQDHRDTGSLLQITVVDEAASATARGLERRYPKLPVRCKLVAYDLTPDQLALTQAPFVHEGPAAPALERVYICLGDHRQALLAAMTARRCLDGGETPIVVRLPEGTGLSALLAGPGRTGGTVSHLHPFGLLERTCTPDLVLGGTHEFLARGFHGAYLSERRRGRGLDAGNRAHVPWQELPEDLKEANRRQVDRVSDELRAAGYRIRPLTDWDAAQRRFAVDEIDLMARLEHTYWMEDLQRRGWKHGPRRDPSEKTHPDLVPWERLSDAEKDKNRRAVEALPALLARAGFEVYRRS